MKRVLLFLTLIYTAGIAVGLLVRLNPMCFAVIFISLLFISLILHIKGRKVFCLIYLSVFILGIFIASSKFLQADSKIRELEGQHITIHGQILEDITRKDRMVVFNIYTDSIETTDRIFYYNVKLRVIDYKNSGNYVIPYNTVELKSKLDSRQQYRNKGLQNYGQIMFGEGIYGTVIAEYNPGLKSYNSQKRFIQKFFYNTKFGLESILKKYTNSKSFAMLKGILFGDASDMGEDEFDVFEKCGIVHIFAVSGYNIWLLYSLIFYGLFFLDKHNVIKTLISLLLLGIYTLLSGSTFSVVRAYVMASIVLLGKMAKRKSDPMTSLSAAAFIILTYNPFAIMDRGFQLSFLSVASIILILPELNRKMTFVPDKLKNPICLTLSVQIGILPFIIYYFNSFPAFSLLANFIIVPLVSAVTILGVLLCLSSQISIYLAYAAGSIINFLTSIILSIAEFIGSVPYSNFNTVSPSFIEISIYYILVVIVFKVVSIKENIKRFTIYGIAMFLVFSVIAYFIPNQLTIKFVDVGQGDCIFITTPDRKNILIDGGGKTETQYSQFDIGENILKPYLLKHGVKNIDLLISTHSHDDHLKGLIPVIQNFYIGKFAKTKMTAQDNYNDILKLGMIDLNNVLNVSAGDVIEVGKYINLYVLNPADTQHDENDSSLVLKLVYKNFSALFTGDIGSDIERKLAEGDIKADVLKVPHHGSAKSLDLKFLELVNPSTAVICVGKNTFGHPADITIEKIEAKKIRLYRTDRHGEVTISTRGEGYRVETAVQ